MIEMREFTIAQTPPSSNDPCFKNKAGTMRVGREWSELITAALESLDLPRPIPCAGPLRVVVTLRFRVRRNQECENYRGFFVKRFNDCMMGGHPNYHDGETRASRPVGWIADDKDDQIQIMSFDINRDRGEPGTTVRLLWEPAAPVHRGVYAPAA